ncbi:helix-turn-helix domain-containing protein [Pseudonocardia kunmingensis]|uniref:AraC family transcriptional regulator n=1 Tax=Pseudonocardia kunmingensis TaxID=630975 RepID=A0A543E381_9PSEU|nr:AraC family transcriptional regulator [Pseudonocardia kunmingensis]TQM16003.1 AraC family transcriptional regulator [Pseudonocardia kunmingensis]
MEYVARAPAAPLAPIVDDLYYLAGTPPYPRLAIPPMPSALVVINLAAPFRVTHPGGSEDFADGFAWATPTCRTTFEYPPCTRSVGVHLKPWGLTPLTGVPAASLGLPVPVGAVWGTAAVDELADRLDGAATPGAMLDVLEAALLARARPVRGLGLVHDTSTRIGRSAGRVSIASLAETAGVSSTHLATRFKHLVGTTPKRLARTYRFAEVVRSIDPARGVDWAELAHRAGYHDQPHFTHELRQFTGLTPTGYLGLRRRFAAEHPGNALDVGLLPHA